ncbi:MAG: efflux RND transporter permease subunit [Deltaproteobacteria bacterium]|nr:efflux RND transporter permease subunit [Deltaproteobacteria bacterium]
MKNLLRFTLTQTVFVNLVFVMLMIVGAFAVLRMPVERYPNVNFGKVVVSTYFPGASPQDVENLVTRKIEKALDGMEDVEFVRSTSYRERSSIIVKFVDDTDYDRLYDELRFRVQGTVKDLPETIDPPGFTLIDVNEWLPVITVNLLGDRENRALSLIAEELRIPLEAIPGVNKVTLQGEYVREFHVMLDPDRLAGLGLTFDDVSAALRSDNLSVPAGDFNRNGQFAVAVDEKFRTRRQVMDTVIRTDADGTFVRVSDVATDARLAYRDPFVVASVNGRDCVSLHVVKSGSGNALTIYDQVMEVLDDFRVRFDREGIETVLTNDSTVKVKDSMRTLGSNLLVGIVLVFGLIWAFMGLRNAALTTVGIPFAFLTTMVVMYLTGNSVNEISLFAFVLVSGIIVDDAIIVVENIYRHIQTGKARLEAVIDGTAEVLLPIVAATLTTVAAFLPMLIMTGSTGEFFAIIPKAVAFALVASLLECLIILPSHVLEYGPGTPRAEETSKEFFLLAWTRSLTNVLLGLTLRFRFTSIVVVTLLLAGAVAIFGLSLSGQASLIRIKFFPDDYSLYYVNLDGPVGTTIDQVSDRLKDVSRTIMDDGPNMAMSASAFAGFYLSEDYETIFGDGLGMIQVTLPSTRDRIFADHPINDPLAHLDAMRSRVEALLEGSGFKVEIRAEKDGPPAGKDISVRVVGTSDDSVRALSRDVLDFLRTDTRTGPGLVELGDDQGRPIRVFRFSVLRDRAAEYGLTTAQVASLAGAVLDGRYVGTFRMSDEDIDLKLSIDPSALDSPAKALDMPLRELPRGTVRLGDMAVGSTALEPGFLNRFKNQRSITITANIRHGSALSVPAVTRQITEHYQANRDRYPGASLDFSGEFQSTRNSYTSLSYAFVIAILAIYSILAVQFRSYLQPLIILSAVVFALIGMIYGTFLAQTLFTINSFIAVVGVTGVVVNDSLVLIEFINKLYAAGLSRREAILEGVRVRLRPILLTTLTTTLGLLPMALGIPEYSVVWGTMATTFVTGLCTSTFLTIVMVPVQWDILTQAREWLDRRRGRETEALVDPRP